MKKWLALLAWFVLSSTVQAQTFSSYFQVGDTDPLTYVWETSSGGYVVTTTPGYQTFLATVAATPQGTAVGVCGSSSNGGLVQIRVCNPLFIGSWATGQIRTVFGTGTSADGTWRITVDNITTGLMTLQGSTFGAAASAGTIGAAPLIDTSAHLYGQIDKYNRFAFVSGQTYFVPAIINATTTLTNPLAPSYFVEMPGTGLFVTLPQANVIGSIPIGQPLLLFNPGFNGFTVRDMNLNVITTVANVQSIMLMLLNNGTKQGSWSFVIGSN